MREGAGKTVSLERRALETQGDNERVPRAACGSQVANGRAKGRAPSAQGARPGQAAAVPVANLEPPHLLTIHPALRASNVQQHVRSNTQQHLSRLDPAALQPRLSAQLSEL